MNCEPVKYTKVFYADNLTDRKYNELLEFAIMLRDFRNKVSLHVNEHLMDYMNITKYDFVKLMRSKYHGELSSYFDNALYVQVFTAYKNRFTTLQHKISFKHRTLKGYTKYKRNCQGHKKGDLKSVQYKVKATPLSITLTYLSRYGSPDILEYVKNQIAVCDTQEKREFYQNIVRCIEKFGFDRLYSLAIRKRNRILSYYRNPIEFKSLNFTGRTAHQTTPILAFNKNRHSKISGFITLNVPFRKAKFEIPVKLSMRAHGHPDSYKKYTDKKSQYLYTVRIDELEKQVSIGLCKDGIKQIPTPDDSYIGIDVNIKNNLFSLSDGSAYDFDRNLVNAYLRLLNKVDNATKLNPQYKPGRTRSIKLRHFARQVKHSNERLIVRMCKDIKAKGYGHIVMENLDNSFTRSYVKNQDFGEKYTRIASLIHLSSLKDEVKHIANNYGICVSFVQSEYTSQMCPVCGCIESESRPNQETFCCINCGHTDNADHNAAVNIRNRVQETVFRNALLKQNPDGTYVPKSIKHDKIKDILLRSSNCISISSA